jgi:hypothetical protein
MRTDGIELKGPRKNINNGRNKRGQKIFGLPSR